MSALDALVTDGIVALLRVGARDGKHAETLVEAFYHAREAFNESPEQTYMRMLADFHLVVARAPGAST